jgi:hypothetical protein
MLVEPFVERGFTIDKCPRASKMRTEPPCVLESVIVMPFTARLNMFCGAFLIEFVFLEDDDFALDEELLFILDEELLFVFSMRNWSAPLTTKKIYAEELLSFADDEDSDLLEEDSVTELLDATELEVSTFEELDSTLELLDSTEEDEIDDDETLLELLDCELLDRPNFE